MKLSHHPGISTIASIIIVVVFGAAIATTYVVTKNRNPLPEPESQAEVIVEQQNNKSQRVEWLSGWGGAYYKSNWKVDPISYASPAVIESGGTPSVLGNEFTLPSGAGITWGGHQSMCSGGELSNFEYGVSVAACVLGIRADVRGAQGSEPSQQDKNEFGDFVRKNQNDVALSDVSNTQFEINDPAVGFSFNVINAGVAAKGASRCCPTSWTITLPSNSEFLETIEKFAVGGGDDPERWGLTNRIGNETFGNNEYTVYRRSGGEYVYVIRKGSVGFIITSFPGKPTLIDLASFRIH